jgi:methionyl-tRNA formyltransferase
MRIVFMGTPAFAVPALDALATAGHQVACVVAQPDRPAGRGNGIRIPATKEWALARGIPILQPEKVRDGRLCADLAALRPDLLAVAAYGRILGNDLLTLAPWGAINVHGSLLPKYRGAAPIQWTLANGDTETGVTIMFMSARMDAGDIILQEITAVRDDDTAATLEPRLAAFGAGLMARAVGLFSAGGPVPRVPQDESRVTLAPKLNKEDGRVDWKVQAAVIRNRVRGFHPWPCCRCEYPAGSGQHLKLLRARVEDGSGEPGCVLGVDREGPLVATGLGGLRLVEVQPEGRQAMTGRAFANGAHLKTGDRFA